MTARAYILKTNFYSFRRRMIDDWQFSGYWFRRVTLKNNREDKDAKIDPFIFLLCKIYQVTENNFLSVLILFLVLI